MSGLDFNGDGNVLPEAVIGYAALSAAANTRRSNEIQLAQLNLLRAHQGLPPVEYQPGHNWMATLILWPFAIIFLLVFGRYFWVDHRGWFWVCALAIGFYVFRQIGSSVGRLITRVLRAL